jgi:hypothetical protein
MTYTNRIIPKVGCYVFQTSDIVRLEHYSDYVEIALDNGETHVIPMAVFRHVASGKLTVNRISDFIPIYREITRQWMALKGYK